jgi:hypothetical protein
MKEAVAAGLGRGIVLDGEMGADERLTFLRLRTDGPAAGEYAVALPEMREVPAVAAFMELAASALQPVGARRQRAT